MSQDIVQEITLFLHSILAGLLITFAYDWILIARELVRHRTVLISIEDFFFLGRLRNRSFLSALQGKQWHPEMVCRGRRHDGNGLV